MPADAKKELKLADGERHGRFLEMAREVEASVDPKEFEEAFSKALQDTKLKRKIS